jgi:hypothetical protein
MPLAKGVAAPVDKAGARIRVFFDRINGINRIAPRDVRVEFSMSLRSA